MSNDRAAIRALRKKGYTADKLRALAKQMDAERAKRGKAVSQPSADDVPVTEKKPYKDNNNLLIDLSDLTEADLTRETVRQVRDRMPSEMLAEIRDHAGHKAGFSLLTLLRDWLILNLRKGRKWVKFIWAVGLSRGWTRRGGDFIPDEPPAKPQPERAPQPSNEPAPANELDVQGKVRLARFENRDFHDGDLRRLWGSEGLNKAVAEVRERFGLARIAAERYVRGDAIARGLIAP